MNRRVFSTSVASVAATMPAWSQARLPFSALGACSSLDKADGIKAAAGEYVEESVQRFLVPAKPDSEWAVNLERAKACPLPIPACNGFLPESLKCTGPEPNHEGVLHYAETAFKRANQIGVKIIVFGSSGSRALPDGFPVEKAVEQFVALLKRMGPLAQAYGVTIAIEPLRRQECNFINTVAEGAAIAEKVNHPNIRLLFDAYHMLQNGEDPNDLKKAGHLLVHGHIAEKETRSAPGVAGDDFRPFFSALRNANYQGRISIEGKWKPEQLGKAYEVLRQQARTA
jgi:sugar phosphate isomerase/epimerase